MTEREENHMPRHEVHVGDELLVEGRVFVITEMRDEINKPSVLVTKQPVELIGPPAVMRRDRYTITVEGHSLTATPEQEARIAALDAEGRDLLLQVLGKR